MPLFLSVRQSRLVAPLVVCNVQLSSAVNTAIYSSFIFAFHLYVLFVNSNAHIMFVFFMEKEININLHTNRLEYHLKSDACALVASVKTAQRGCCAKGDFYSESAMCFSNLQKNIFQKIILNLKFKFQAQNSFLEI